MAADFIYGVDGAIYLGGNKVSYMNGWSMAINTGVVDTPDLGSSGPVRTYSKYHDFTGQVNGAYRFDDDTTSETAQEDVTHQFVLTGTPAAVVAKFIESSKSMYYGNVVLTNITKNQPADGVQSWSGDWAQSNGPLAWSSDTSTS
jgi:hypothetical protein